MGQTWAKVCEIWDQSFPPPSHFAVEDIPDLSGKVIIVTGGYSGIGFEIVKALLLRNARVYIASRRRDKGLQAIEELKGITGQEALFLELDLADLNSVKKAAEEFASKESELHILFNNAGVAQPPIDLLTAQGYDLTWGTNCLGPFYFTKLLLPILTRTAVLTPTEKARIVWTSSMTHLFQDIQHDSFRDGDARRKLGPDWLYSQSKQGNIILALEVARRYADKGIISISVNPGNCQSEMQRHMHPIVRFIMNKLLHPVHLGALTPLWAATSSATENMNGRFLIPWARIGSMLPQERDPSAGEKLWSWMEEQTRQID